MSFRNRLDREQKKYGEYEPKVTITDAEKQQHYLEQVLREPERWGEKCVTAWEKKQKAGASWEDAHKHFEKRQATMEAYESLGGKENNYASANAATELQEGIHLAVKEAVRQSNEEAAMAVA